MREISERFVCVRMVKMNGVDLRQFQFDYDMTWAAFFLHHDGTIFARYGTRSAAGPMSHNSAKGLVATMRRVLDVYPQYPARRALFAAKKGPDPGYAVPEDIRSEHTRPRIGRIGRGNCIHCHNVHEAFHEVEKRATGRPKVVFKFPLPANLGLSIDRDRGNVITRVVPGSPASEAGLAAGDEISTLDGQAIYSIADVQFVLHHIPANTPRELPVEVRRGGETLERILPLRGSWKLTDFTWRQSLEGFPVDRGFYVHKLGAVDRRKLGIAEGKVALEIRGLFSSEVKASALRVGDVIIGYDGKTAGVGPIGFSSHVRVHHHQPGSILQLDVIRGGKNLRLKVRYGSHPRPR